MDLQKTSAIAALVVGLLVLVLSVALIGTPLTDVGMLSTVLVLVLLGVVGLVLNRRQTA